MPFFIEKRVNLKRLQGAAQNVRIRYRTTERSEGGSQSTKQLTLSSKERTSASFDGVWRETFEFGVSPTYTLCCQFFCSSRLAHPIISLYFLNIFANLAIMSESVFKFVFDASCVLSR